MRSDWLGDSYDIVKRFFVSELQSIGYAVYVDPMETGDWGTSESTFLRLLGASHVREVRHLTPSALLLDPDTGIKDSRSKKHVSIAKIATYLDRHEIVFVFDQSFSRGAAPVSQIKEKLRQLEKHGASAFYYDSHARFLFVSLSSERLNTFRAALLKAGLPEHRLVALTSLTGLGHG